MLIPLGAVQIDTEGNRYFKVVTEEYENQLDDLMFKTVEEDWMVLV